MHEHKKIIIKKLWMQGLVSTMRGCSTTIIFFIISSFVLVAHADELNVSAVKQAINQLKALNTKIPPLVSSVGAINFGPFNFKGTCKFNCSVKFRCLWYCCDSSKWSYKPDFGYGKDLVKQAYNNVGSVADRFPTYFSSTRLWLLNDVPKINSAFSSILKTTSATVKTLNSASANSVQKAKTNIINEINKLLSEMNLAKRHLIPAVQGISNFQKSWASAFSGITRAENNVDNMFKAAEKSVSDSSLSCGKSACMNDLKKQEARMKDQLAAVRVQSSSVSVSKVDHGTSLLLGSLVSLQGQLNGIVQNLKNAKITPPGAVQKLRLIIAQKSWQQLASYAQTELK